MAIVGLQQNYPANSVGNWNFTKIHAKAMTHKFEWCEVAGRGPGWIRRAALSEDGTVFVPSVVAGSEMEVFLCAGYDGVPAILDEGHVYYPAEWIAREFPEAKDLAEKIERRTKEYFACS